MTRGRLVMARPLPVSVRTTMRVRSARNRSRENSIGSPSASVVVRVMAISGAPGSMSRMAASSAEARTTSIRSTASVGSVPKCSSSSS
jgi:hypothetical protein